MNLNFPSFCSQNSETEKLQTTQLSSDLCHKDRNPPRQLFTLDNIPSGSSNQKRKTFRLTLKPEDFLDDSPPRKTKVPRNLFSNSQFSNGIKKVKPSSSGFLVNSANNIRNGPLISINNDDTVNNRNLKLRFTLKPEDFLDTPPEKNKRKVNRSKATSHKQKENNPTVFVKPKKPAAKAHNAGFSFRTKKVTNTGKPNCNSKTRSNPPLSSNPDESQPLLNVDEVGDVLIKNQSVFKERRRFFPSIGSIPKSPDQSRKHSSILNKPSRRISMLKRKVISPIQETIAALGPTEKRHKDISKNHIDVNDETPPQNLFKESLQENLLKKAIKNSVHKNYNCCTPLNSNSADSQVSSIQSFVRIKVASSRKRLLNLTSQRIIFSSPDTDFLNEEKNCGSTEKLVENIKMTKEKCDKETQTDQFSDIFKDMLIASEMLRKSLQKLGMKID